MTELLYAEAIAALNHYITFVTRLEEKLFPTPATSHRLRKIAHDLYSEFRIQIALQYGENQGLTKALTERYEFAIWTIHGICKTTQNGPITGVPT
jgi:hypothetical protein